MKQRVSELEKKNAKISRRHEELRAIHDNPDSYVKKGDHILEKMDLQDQLDELRD